MPSALVDLLDLAFHVEIGFRHFIVLSFQNLLKSAYGFLNRHLPSLPAGVSIQPFYDRSNLVDRAVGTVSKALLEGRFAAKDTIKVGLKNGVITFAK